MPAAAMGQVRHFLPSHEDQYHNTRDATGICGPRCKCPSRRTRENITSARWQCRRSHIPPRGPACGVCPPGLLLRHSELSGIALRPVLVMSGLAFTCARRSSRFSPMSAEWPSTWKCASAITETTARQGAYYLARYWIIGTEHRIKSQPINTSYERRRRHAAGTAS